MKDQIKIIANLDQSNLRHERQEAIEALKQDGMSEQDIHSAVKSYKAAEYARGQAAWEAYQASGGMSVE